jgi:hypothetical protein
MPCCGGRNAMEWRWLFDEACEALELDRVIALVDDTSDSGCSVIGWSRLLLLALSLANVAWLHCARSALLGHKQEHRSAVVERYTDPSLHKLQ